MTTPPPALPNATDLKNYLRIQTNRENTLLTDLITEAIATIEAVTGKSLSTESVTWYDDARSFKLYTPCTSLMLVYTPILESSVVVRDQGNVVVDAASYVIRQDLRQILALGNTLLLGDGFLFDNGPYTIACTAGFGTSPVYATRWLPRIKRVVIDLAAFYYQQRTPGARAEMSAGAHVDYEVDDATGLPKRIAAAVCALRGPIVTVS